MLLSLFLVSLLAQNVQPSPDALAVGLPAAIELAQQGRNAEALAALQKIVAANPDDHLTRLWIAKVYDQMGRPDLAEAVYHSIILEDPRNVDALLGVGTTLLQMDRISEAIDMLSRAEALAPRNPNVLAALAAANRLAGHGDRSLTYYEEVVAVSPTMANRLALETARREHGHRFDSQTYDEQFNGATPDTRGSDMAVNFRLSDAWRVFGRGQLQTKFGTRENREGGGFEWRWTPFGVFTGQALVGGSNRILPQHDYLGRVDYGYHRATWTGQVRYFDFFGANVTLFSPGVTYAPTPVWTIGVRYALTSTTTTTQSGVRGNTFDLRVAREIRPRLWVRGGYIHGIDNFDLYSIDQIGDFKANIAHVGAQFVFPSLTSIVGTYEFQSRANGVHMARFNIGLAQTF